MSAKKDTEVTFLQMKQLQINPFQPREKIVDDEAFLELVESVRVQGVLEPLVVVNTPAGYQIIAGERRFRAAKRVGIEKVPVHLITTSPKGMLEIAVVENIQRQDLSPIEKAQALNRLIQEFGYTTAQLSEKLGKSEHYIKQSLKLLKLPDPVKDGLNKGLINETQGHAILVAGDEKSMIDCYRQVVKEGASAQRARTLANFFRERINARVEPIGRKNTDLRGQIWQSYLQEKLKTKTAIDLSNSTRGTKIVITLKGKKEEREADLERIMKITGIDLQELEKKLDEAEAQRLDEEAGIRVIEED